MPLESLLGPKATSAIAYVVAALTLFSLLYGFAKVAWSKITGKPFPHNALTRQLDALAELGSNVIGFVNKLNPSSPLIANPEVLRREAMLAEVRAELAAVTARLPAAPPSVGPLAPAADPVAPALPTPAEPASILRATSVSYRPPASDDGNAAAYELARREVAAARVFDPLSRETVAPTEPPSQGGSVEGGAMLGACIVALAASLLFVGCPDWQRPACPAPGAYSCVRDTPHYCARTTRELTPVGDEPCSSQSRVCALNDAGIAYCARLDAAVSE